MKCLHDHKLDLAEISHKGRQQDQWMIPEYQRAKNYKAEFLRDIYGLDT